MSEEVTDLMLTEESEPTISDRDAKKIAKKVKAQLDDLNLIREKVVKATEQARMAQNRAINDKVHMGWFGKRKAAIEELQEVVAEMATAQMSAAEAQELMFKFQTQLANASVFLASLCVGNAKATSVVMREIKHELRSLARESSNDQLVEAQRKTMETVRKQIQGQLQLEKRVQQLEGGPKKKGRAGKIILWIILIMVAVYFVALFLQEKSLLGFSIPSIGQLREMLQL